MLVEGVTVHYTTHKPNLKISMHDQESATTKWPSAAAWPWPVIKCQVVWEIALFNKYISIATFLKVI